MFLKTNGYTLAFSILSAMFLFFCYGNQNDSVCFAGSVFLSESAIIDKVKGGWVGQMAGVAWGAPTEFQGKGRVLAEYEIPAWLPEMVNNGFNQDDIYVEIPFLEAMKKYGVNATWSDFGNEFLNTSFGLCHANYFSRANLQKGIIVPDNAHYSNTPHSDDIDWQIEADFAGMINPGQINSAIELAWRAGHMINYGDGVYGGVFVAAMHAKAFTANNVNEIIEAGRQAVPVGSKFRQVIEDVIAWNNAGKTWEENWRLLESKWGQDDRCPQGISNVFNIDAKLNAAYVLIGLLYGDGDFEQSMRISMRCGQDSDCNPSTVGSIMGNFLGYSAIPDKWKSALNVMGNKFANTSYTFNDAINVNLELARKSLATTGGTISGGVWYLPNQSVIVPPILEQWPLITNSKPSLTVNATDLGNRTFTFNAQAADSDGIKSYQWFFGDTFYANGANVNHQYAQNGAYEAVCYVTDMQGNTTWEKIPISVGGTPVNIASQGNIIASVFSPLGGGNKNIETIRDGIKPSPLTATVSQACYNDSYCPGYCFSDAIELQYDSFVGNGAIHEEHYGYTFNKNKKFSKIIFTEGKHFWDGGWFANGSLRVQVLQNGAWIDAQATLFPSYPNTNNQNLFGPNFESYTFNLNNIVGNGIRIVGDAGGSAHFVSIGELEVWGVDHKEAACANECSAFGAMQCFGSAYKICDNYDLDSCLEWSVPADCPPGQICSNNQCSTVCVPKTCASLGNYKCGLWSDGCGKTINCGVCKTEKTCSNGKCVENCAPQTNQKCEDGNLYWYNSCGVKEKLAENCGVDTTTDNYRCRNEWTQKQIIKRFCMNGACASNFLWIDDTDCSAAKKICSNGKCVLKNFGEMVNDQSNEFEKPTDDIYELQRQEQMQMQNRQMGREEILAKIAQIRELLIQLIIQLIAELQKQLAILQ
ncbi:MAG: ADP-ribosylglycohydrolase family protein [Candidatus Nealsonbacteria bacterium DGGOD1a]|nr:MAG: ADP-ribosylglycohydrolase family protein [Candidatus Nealsonbacteria bacterium DGGOD1a]